MSLADTLNIRREPFSMSPDPRFFYKSREHQFVLDRLEIAVRLRRGMSVVLADIGLGKTTLLRTLIRNFALEEEEYRFHLILDTAFKTEQEFLDHLLVVFGVGAINGSLSQKRDAIQRHLYQENMERGRTVVLCIDEAQKLSGEHLEYLRIFLNYENTDHKFLQLVIFGQMELLPVIKNKLNFLDRVSFNHILHPMDFREMSSMIRYRLQEAGIDRKEPVFTEGSLHKIYQHTQGYPRRVIKLCQRAFEPLIVGDYMVVTEPMIDKILAQDYLWA